MYNPNTPTNTETNLKIKKDFIDLTNKYLNKTIDTDTYSNRCFILEKKLLQIPNYDQELLGILFLADSLKVYKSSEETMPQNHIKAIRHYLHENK